MAELTTPTSSCCAAEAQASCCEPAEKAACCDASAASGSCGCAARQTDDARVKHLPSCTRTVVAVSPGVSLSALYAA